MREMKDSGVDWIGSVPASWQTLTVGSLFKVRNEKVNDTDYPPLSVTKVGVVPQMENVAKSDANDNRKKVLANDFVINSRSDRKQSCGVSPLDGSVSLINTVLYPAKGVPIVPEYLNYLLKNHGFAEEFYRWGHGIVADLWTTRWQEMKSILLPIPSMEEQQQILDAISTQIKKVDSLINNVQTQIEKLKAYKQSVITEVVTKGLEPTVPMKDSGFDWIGSIPAHWEKLRVKYIGDTQNGISKGGEYFGSGYPFVSYGDVYKNMELPHAVVGLVESTDAERENYSVKKGDIFFTRTSETIEEVGFSAVCTETIDDATFAGFLIRLRPFNDAMTTQYAKYYFRGEHIRRYLVKEMNLVTRASLGQGLLKAMTVLIPPYEEQIAIAKFLDDKCNQIDRLISIKQAKIEKLEQYKRSLIYEYVTGKREVV